MLWHEAKPMNSKDACDASLIVKSFRHAQWCHVTHCWKEPWTSKRIPKFRSLHWLTSYVFLCRFRPSSDFCAPLFPLFEKKTKNRKAMSLIGIPDAIAHRHQRARVGQRPSNFFPPHATADGEVKRARACASQIRCHRPSRVAWSTRSGPR